MNNPTLLTEPICTGGTLGTDYNSIPDTSATTGALTQKYGMPVANETSFANGGVPPTRQDLNGLFYLLSSILFHCQKGRIFDWDSTQAYYTHALVWENSQLWWCKADVSTPGTAPHNDTTHWQTFDSYIKSVMTINWSDIVGRPTAVSAFTNDSDYQSGSDVTATLATYATQAFVNSSINALAAYYITKNAAGDPFSTRAELMSASTFYCGGEVRTPTRNDYVVVLRDENYGGNSTRYTYNNGWEYQYTYNMQFTEAQTNAINSGVTSSTVAQVATNTSNIASKANTADLNTIAFSGLPVATASVLGGVKKGEGINIASDGTITVDTSALVNLFDWTQLNTSEKIHDNGSSGVINLTNGRVQITSASTITMPTPPTNCATWVTLWCTAGQVTFSSSGATVYYESSEAPTIGTGVGVYTLAGIGNGVWYCMFAGTFQSTGA